MKAASHLNNLSFNTSDTDLRDDLIDHVTTWNKCHRCPLAANAEHHVFFRGSVPCDLMFIGEAPGTTEDSLGTPFIGRSGKLLDRIILEAAEPFKKSMPTYLITNTVACIPLNDQGEIRPPDKSEVAVCADRVLDLIDIATPKGIVLVGKVAQKLSASQITKLLHEGSIPSLSITHPAFLLRKGGASQTNTDYRRTVLELRKFIGLIQAT